MEAGVAFVEGQNASGEERRRRTLDDLEGECLSGSYEIIRRSRIDGKAGNRRSQRAYGAVRHSPPNIAIGIGKEKRRRVFESSRGAKACVRNSVVLGKSMKNANIVRKVEVG